LTRGSWAHQEREYKLGRSKRSRALFWSMRTGKTKAVLDKACFQHSKGNIEGVIVLAPNGVHINWVRNEVPKWAWQESDALAFAWEMTKRADFDNMAAFDRLLNHKGLKVFALNMEALRYEDTIKAIQQFQLACDNRFMLVLSEAHHFGRAGARRTRLARNLSRKAAFVTIETGTPILNSPLRAYSLFHILMGGLSVPPTKGVSPGTYEEFVRYFAEYEADKAALSKPKSQRRKAYKKLKCYKNLDELREKMAPYTSVVLRDEVEDMPELIRVDRPVVMSELQRRAYLEMTARHLVEIGEDMVAAADGGPRVMKLQQILNGYVMDTELNKIIEIDPEAPIYTALREQVEGSLPGKTLVWARYREDIRRCVEVLKPFGVLEYHGGVPNTKREGIRLEFNDPNSGKHVLVGQPGAGGEGKDFSGADTILYFSSTPNAIHIKQSEERATVKGGKKVSIVRLRTYGTVDDRNWDICEGKFTLADSVSGQGLRELLLATNV
jgi:SNF2 family DNA or RNA helicase